MYLLKKKLVSYFPPYKFLSIYHHLLYQAHQVFFSSILQEDNQYIWSNAKLNSITITFPQPSIQEEYYHFSPNKKITDIGQPVLPPKKKPSGISINKKQMEKVTTIIISAAWDISKFQSIYMWENFHRIIQIVESRIEFNSKATDLYDSQYCFKEDENCPLQSSHFNSQR